MRAAYGIDLGVAIFVSGIFNKIIIFNLSLSN